MRSPISSRAASVIVSARQRRGHSDSRETRTTGAGEIRRAEDRVRATLSHEPAPDRFPRMVARSRPRRRPANLPRARLRSTIAHAMAGRDEIFDDANGDLAVGELENAVEKYRRCVELDSNFFDGWHALG